MSDLWTVSCRMFVQRLRFLRLGIQRIASTAYRVAVAQGRSGICHLLLTRLRGLPLLQESLGYATPDRGHLVKIQSAQESTRRGVPGRGGGANNIPTIVEDQVAPGGAGVKPKAGDRVTRLFRGNRGVKHFDAQSAADVGAVSAGASMQSSSDVGVSASEVSLSNAVVLEVDTRPIEFTGLVEAARQNDVPWLQEILLNAVTVKEGAAVAAGATAEEDGEGRQHL